VSEPGERLALSLAALRKAGIAALARRRGVEASGPELVVAAMRRAPVAEVVADLEAAHSGFLRHAAYRLRKRCRRIVAAMRASAIGRLLVRTGAISGAALLLCAQPAMAQRGDVAEANRLLGEARSAWDATAREVDELPELRARERMILEAVGRIARIRCEHAATPAGREIAAGTGTGMPDVTHEAIAARLEKTRRAIRSKESLRELEQGQDRLLCEQFGSCLPVGAGAAPARQVLRDCPDCPELAVLPRGSFRMGATPGEEELEGVPCDERARSSPQVMVQVARDFAIGRFEVTRGEYAAFVREAGEASPSSCMSVARQPARSWRDPGFAQDDRHPAVCVSWDDAQRYVAWLSRRTSKRYRLPSEAEWEYAARAGMEWPRPWTGGLGAYCEHANIFDRSGRRGLRGAADATVAPCDDGFDVTARIGSFRANAFGLHDMIGNASEWVSNCWSPSLAAAAITGDHACELRSVRGGGWLTAPRDARPAFRSLYPADVRAAHIGFRVARDM